MLDPDKAKQLNCSSCTLAEQSLRNCSGKGSPAKVFLNDHLHTRCPRAVFLESQGARAIVQVYFECRNNRTYPAAGGVLNQTKFCIDIFEFLDEKIALYKRRRQNKANAEAASHDPKNKTRA